MPAVRGAFAALSAISLFTDIADGFMARRLDQETKRGAVLDSAGDLVTLLLVAAGIYRYKQEFVKRNKVILIALAALYVLQLSLAYGKYGKFSSFHTYSSKTAFAAMGVFCLLLLLNKELRGLFRISSLAMALALIEDIALVFLLDHPRENVKGVYWVRK